MQQYNKIEQYLFEIEYAKGKDNFIVDYLSQPTK